MALIDTSILLRHFLQDDPERSARATAYLRRVQHGELEVHTTETVIFETVFMLQRRARLPRAVIRDSLLPFIDLPNVLLPGKQRLREAFAIYVELNLPFADAYHAVVARDLNPPEILAFDRHFERVPGITAIAP